MNALTALGQLAATQVHDVHAKTIDTMAGENFTELPAANMRCRHDRREQGDAEPRQCGIEYDLHGVGVKASIDLDFPADPQGHQAATRHALKAAAAQCNRGLTMRLLSRPRRVQPSTLDLPRALRDLSQSGARQEWIPVRGRIGWPRRCLLRSNLPDRRSARIPDEPSGGSRGIDGVLNCAELMRSDAGNVIPMNLNAASADRVAFTQREPIGVVVAVSAFNHPLNLIVHQVGPAIAAGCPVIVKPAGDTPLSCMRFVSLLREAGLPAEWCQALVTESNDISTALVCDARVGFFSFIGSSRVGWMLRSKLAPGTRCALEHGGAAPVIVAADADLEMASTKLAKGGFYHAGQVCVSVQRVFAHRSIARRLAEALADRATRLKVGDPTMPDTEVGPLIRPAEVQRVDDWSASAARRSSAL